MTETLLRDVTHWLRQHHQDLGFALTAIATLAPGIGALWMMER